MNNSLSGFLENSNSAIIILPLKPFFDQVAAGLSLYLAIRGKKDVQIYSPSEMIVEFNRLIGVNKITQELGNKNLIIEFLDYKATDIERVSYDIKEGQFKLTVIPKQKVSPPKKDKVELTYSGISADCVILVGGANESHFPAVFASELSGASIAHIGTKDITFGKNYTSFARPASSVSEIVYGLIKESDFVLDEDSATNLLAGIESATNYLSDPSMGADTFSVVSELMRLGAKRSVRLPGTEGRVILDRRASDSSLGGARGSSVVFGKDRREEAKSPSGTSAPSDWLSPKIYKGASNV